MWLIVATASFTIALLATGVSIVLTVKWNLVKLIGVSFSRDLKASKSVTQGTGKVTTQTLLTDSVSVTKDLTKKTTITKEHFGEQVEKAPEPRSKVETNGNLSRSLNKVKTTLKPKGSVGKKSVLEKLNPLDGSYNNEQDENQGNKTPSSVSIEQNQNLGKFESELDEYPKIESATTLLSSLEEPKTTDVTGRAVENATQLLDEEPSKDQTTLLEDIFENDDGVEQTDILNSEEGVSDQSQTTILTERANTDILTGTEGVDQEDEGLAQEDESQTSILDEGELEVYEDVKGKTSELDQTDHENGVVELEKQDNSLDNSLDNWGNLGVVPTQSGGIDEDLGGKITLNLDNVTESEYSDEDDSDEVDMRGKTQIITDVELQGKYKKELLTEEDTMEFHTFEVLEVVTSYNSYIR